MKYLLISILAFSSLFAQTAPQNQPQEVVVRLQTQAAPIEKPVEKPIVQKVNEWVEFGKNVGAAMDAGLSSLTDHADKFSKTDAGKFTMAVIAWRVAGRDAFDITKYVTDKIVRVGTGIVLLSITVITYLWMLRKNFICHRVVIEKSGFWFWGTKKYKVVNEPSSAGEEKYWFAFLSTIFSFVISLVIIFNLIC